MPLRPGPGKGLSFRLSCRRFAGSCLWGAFSFFRANRRLPARFRSHFAPFRAKKRLYARKGRGEKTASNRSRPCPPPAARLVGAGEVYFWRRYGKQCMTCTTNRALALSRGAGFLTLFPHLRRAWGTPAPPSHHTCATEEDPAGRPSPRTSRTHCKEGDQSHTDLVTLLQLASLRCFSDSRYSLSLKKRRLFAFLPLVYMKHVLDPEW